MAVGEEFARVADPFRGELFAHCYRMLGSVHDAEDLVQETFLRAWRAYPGFDRRRASMRTWLYRIATNACLTALAQRGRRPLPSDIVEASHETGGPPTDRRAEIPWLQPAPDLLLGAPPDDPAAVAVARDSVRLAFVAALQHLSGRQRAVLVLRDVLALPAAEVAGLLDTTVTAVNSALQRARTRLAEVAPAENDVGELDDQAQRELVQRYLVAFQNADMDALRRLLHADAVLEMPPYLTWLAGRADVVAFLAGILAARDPGVWRLVPVAANCQPGAASYLRGGDGMFHAHSVQVFTVRQAQVSWIVLFQDPDLFPFFGLPTTMA